MEDVRLFRYFNNEATPDEVRQIERWLQADPEHRKEFDAAHMLFNAIVLQEAHGIGHRDVPRRILRQRVRAVGRAVLRVAAVVALAAGLAYGGVALERSRIYGELARKTNLLEAPAGQRISFRMEDGTSVCLNGGTRMEYPLVFGRDCRRVKLSGEALFEVEHDASRPFVVETFASEIEVLGTKFNVFADDEIRSFSATLVDGCIRATNLLGGGREHVVLQPGEMVRLVDGRLVTSKVSDPDALCWIDGYINIGNIPFDELMRRFEKAYDVAIVVDRPTLPRIDYVSGKIRVSEGIDFALHLLQQAGDFSYTKDASGRTITIR